VLVKKKKRKKERKKVRKKKTPLFRPGGLPLSSRREALPAADSGEKNEIQRQVRDCMWVLKCDMHISTPETPKKRANRNN